MHRPDNLTTFICRLSRNVGASTQETAQACYRIALLYVTVRHKGKYTGLIKVTQAPTRNSGDKIDNIMRSVSDSGWVK